MPNYQNSKIYKIWSPSCCEIYIGATTLPLHQRFYEHKKKYEKFLEGKIISTRSREILKYDDAKIELIKYCPCNSKEELNSIEAEHIRNTENCINLKIPGRSKKQYYEETKEKRIEQREIYYEKNKQKILEQVKQYYEENKQKISEKAKQKINCECGSICTITNKLRHERTKKHKNFMLEIAEKNKNI